jgi:UDP-N-acetyl-D-mannosaminuronic acid dehydrogenase
LASNGFNVVGVDLNEHAVETINQGRIHIVEPDLDAFVRSAIAPL